MPIYFYDNSADLPIFVQTIGNRWNQEAVRREKGFPHYHWLQTERGCGTVRIGRRALRLGPGQGVLIAPGVAHSYGPDSPDGPNGPEAAKGKSGGLWRTSFVAFQGRLAGDIGKIAGRGPYTLAQDSEAFSFQQWTDAMVLACAGGGEDPAGLSVECYRFLTHIGGVGEKALALRQPLYLKYVEPVLAEIERGYAEDLTLQRLAGLVFITPQYLARIFRRYVGMAVHEYVLNYRVTRAKELLLNRPELAVAEVSGLVGMNTVSHFIAVFKEKAGYTPQQFRRLHY